jgi:gas vesicle protein
MWFAAGLGLGTAVGLMAAPQSGAETRRLIGRKADEAGDFLASNSREYVDRGRELYERGKQLADEAALLFDEGKRLMDEADAAEAVDAASEASA